jgi:hypothetical protein
VLKIFKSYGASAVGLLADAAMNEDELIKVRKAVIEELGNSNSLLALSALKILLSSPNKHIRRSCSNALLEIRKVVNEPVLNSAEIQHVLALESVDDLAFLKANAALDQERSDDKDVQALRSKYVASLARRRRHLFRILSLRYDLQSIQASFVALIGEDRHARDTATEYLDNVLHEKIKALAWPLIEAQASGTALSTDPSLSPFDGKEPSVDTNSISPMPVFEEPWDTNENESNIPGRKSGGTDARIRLASHLDGDAIGASTKSSVLAASINASAGGGTVVTAHPESQADPIIEATIVGNANELFESARVQLRTALDTGESSDFLKESLGSRYWEKAIEFI